jgi:hypothetical protein
MMATGTSRDALCVTTPAPDHTTSLQAGAVSGAIRLFPRGMFGRLSPQKESIPTDDVEREANVKYLI